MRAAAIGRRELLRLASSLGAAMLVAGCPRVRSTRVLVLGGTGWIGPHVVRFLRDRGHRITLFNRGVTDPLAFPEIEQLRGDRDGDLSALAGRSWDAVIDLSGTRPEWVRQSAGRLGASIEHYVLLSSTAVYAAFDRRPADESLVLREDGPEYGARKAGCEREAERALPGRVCTPRAVYAVGAGDPDGRLDAWFDAVTAAPTLGLPGSPEVVVQLVDVRDLAAFIVGLMEARAVGPCNVATRTTAGDLVAACSAAVDATPVVEWNNADATALPMWHAPEGTLRYWGELDISRAQEWGFRPRAVMETVRDAHGSASDVK